MYYETYSTSDEHVNKPEITNFFLYANYFDEFFLKNAQQSFRGSGFGIRVPGSAFRTHE